MKRQIRFLALLAALGLALTLTGCASKSEAVPNGASFEEQMTLKPQGKDTSAQKQTKPSQKPDKKQSLPGGDTKTPAEEAAQEASLQQSDVSLLKLRTQMDGGDGAYIHFAVAYLGYVGGLFDEGFEAGFPTWLAEKNPRQLEQNPFLTEIDENHIIGGAGHLYCIVPHDENASLAVNRIHWDPDAMDYVHDCLCQEQCRFPLETRSPT